jgi:hypothetical protein
MVEIDALNAELDHLTRRAATRLLAHPALGSRPPACCWSPPGDNPAWLTLVEFEHESTVV